MQNNSSLQDSVKGSPESAHYLYGSGGSGYNMIYMGTSLSQEEPFYSAGLIYGFKNELFLSASAFSLSAYEPLISFSSLSLSYNKTINSWFDFATTLSRYQVNRKLSDTLFCSFFYGDITLGFDWKLLYTKLSASGLYADSAAAYYQIRNSRYFETAPFGKHRNSFSFDPYVNLLFGTMTETTEGKINNPPFKKGKPRSGGTTVVTKSSEFGLIEISMGVPVSFNTDRFSVEAEPGYSIPLYNIYGSQELKGFFFNLSCIFRFF